MAQRAERREHVYRKASSGGLDHGRAARWCLARIIRESIKYKGLERDRKALPQAFSVTQEAFAWMTIAQDKVFCFRICRASRSSQNLTKSMPVPMAERSCCRLATVALG